MTLPSPRVQSVRSDTLLEVRQVKIVNKNTCCDAVQTESSGESMQKFGGDQ